ncbi:MAG: hypothetical protein PHI31_05690 [Desulfuromonadaceae bacterium]|nr:hypothetical protein [Desulfuromonadaceae bacterium]
MPERTMWLAKAKMIDSYKYRDGDVVIIGSSRAMALNPEFIQSRFGTSAINFSVGGATTPSTYFFIKRILANNPGIKKVYLEFAPINMSSKDTGLSASLGENFIRYVATKEEVEELELDLPGALELYRSIHMFPFSKYINMKDLSLLESIVIRWRTGKSNEAERRQIIDRKGFLLYPSLNSDNESQNSLFDKRANEYYAKIDKLTEKLPSVTAVYLRKMLTLLNSRKVEYVIFFSPVPHVGSLYKHLAFGETFELFKQYSSHINDRILIYDNKYFSEPSHVNKNGSDLFTGFFYECIVNNVCNHPNTLRLFK